MVNIWVTDSKMLTIKLQTYLYTKPHEAEGLYVLHSVHANVIEPLVFRRH